jgi:hypothetical protein
VAAHGAAAVRVATEELDMADANPFVGTWKLVSWEVAQPDGTIHYL